MSAGSVRESSPECRGTHGDFDETHLPAEQARSQKATRVPCPDGDEDRPPGAFESACPGPQAPLRLTGVPLPLTRLRLRRDFVHAARRGRSWAAPGVVLQSVKGKASRKEIRVGFTASRKVGNAVRRNRAKRRLRVLAEAMLPEFSRPGHDYVLIARKATPERAWQALETDLEDVLMKANQDARR